MPYCMYLRKSRKDSENPISPMRRSSPGTSSSWRRLPNGRGCRLPPSTGRSSPATALAGRPVMQQLLQEVRSGQWDGVLVVEIERLARGDTEDQGAVAKAFPVQRHPNRHSAENL